VSGTGRKEGSCGPQDCLARDDSNILKTDVAHNRQTLCNYVLFRVELIVLRIIYSNSSRVCSNKFMFSCLSLSMLIYPVNYLCIYILPSPEGTLDLCLMLNMQ